MNKIWKNRKEEIIKNDLAEDIKVSFLNYQDNSNYSDALILDDTVTNLLSIDPNNEALWTIKLYLLSHNGLWERWGNACVLALKSTNLSAYVASNAVTDFLLRPENAFVDVSFECFLTFTCIKSGGCKDRTNSSRFIYSYK